ncbi:MAG: peptidase M64 [Acidobacteria bacterium]|nr:peptidase M64 [Acidobacteriota bacterium]
MIAAWLLLSLTAAVPQDFDALFTGATMRFDYFHSGTAAEEHVSLDAFRQEGPWPGSRVRLLDDTNLGKYLVQLVDLQSQQVLYSRGFASIYGEWETTGEARRGVWRTFHESQRFPEPRQRTQVVLKRRSADGSFREIHSEIFDPSSRFVDRSPVLAQGHVGTVFENGPPARKVDLLVLGDGYTAAEQEKLESDVRRLMAILFDTQPFARHRQEFNVRWIGVPSQESGVTDPRAGAWRRTPLELSYNAFNSERYVLTFANRRLREIAAQAPYDALILLANNRKYGGGGIFNLWTTAAADSGQSAYLVVHEFGHSFSGLADEYYTSQVSYEDFVPAGVEPWEPNVTALLDPSALKWKDRVAAGTPVPTPWGQERFDEVSLAYQKEREELRAAGASEERMEELFDQVRDATRPLLEGEPFYGKVGAFEGASYEAKGLFRSSVDCIMFTRNPKDFCPVCSDAVERVIRLYAE